MSDTSTVSLGESLTPLPPASYQDPQLLSEPRRCGATAGVTWMRKAFDMFKQNIGVWLGMTFSIFAVPIILMATPVINPSAIFMVTLFIGGFIQTAAIQERGDRLKFEYLFSALKTHLVPLLILTLLYLVGIIVLFIFSVLVLLALSLSNFLEIWSTIDNMGVPSSASWVVVLYMLIILLPMIALTMAFWFAPALIVLHDVTPPIAIKKSFQAVIRNWLPILVFGLLVCFLGILLMMFTFGSASIVAMPVMLLVYYTSYRDVWTDQPLSVS